MHWFEIVLIALCWAIQIGITVVIALVIGGIVQGIEQLIRKKKVKLLPRAAVALVLVCAVLAAFALNPPVTYPEKYEGRLTEELQGPVKSVSRGIYSRNIPLIPVWVEVTELHNFIVDGKMERRVDFTIHYLWFGSVEMNYSSYDGYSCTRPLTGW